MKGGIFIPRKRRNWYPGAIYHVVVRGNHKDDIFMNRNDYLQYMKYLNETNEKYPFKLYSYCLMTNHVHLLIATIDIEIWTIMKDINWHYSTYFNYKYEKVGHLFQDRYYAELIERESYLLQVSKYIHLNPVKACIVDNPIKYPWSSYGVYMGLYRSSLVYEDVTMAYFQYDRELYRLYIESKESEEGKYIDFETVPGTVPGTVDKM